MSEVSEYVYPNQAVQVVEVEDRFYIDDCEVDEHTYNQFMSVSDVVSDIYSL